MAAKLPGWPAPPADPAADGVLLRRFAAEHDEAAFEALVWRHGPAVRAVCRFALGNAADADDAFQATFMVLARKAASVRDPAGVGRWLVAVAGRVARKARARRERFPDTAEDLAVIPARSVPAADDSGAVFDEVDKLPEKYRLPMFLVYAAGHTTADAAAILGTPKGTLLTRLAWARKILAGRLAARGLAPAVAAAAVVPLDPHLVRATVTAAAAYAAGVATLSPAVPLSDGVIRSMTAAKFTTAAGVLFAAVSLTGLGVGAAALTAADPPAKTAIANAPPPVAAPTAAPKPSLPSGGPPPSIAALDALDDLRKQVAELRDALTAERAKPKPLGMPVLEAPNPLKPTATPPATVTMVPPDRDPLVLQELRDRFEEMQKALDPRRVLPPATAMIPPTPTAPAPAPAPKPVSPKASVKEFVISRPVGVWYRQLGQYQFVMKFSEVDGRLRVVNTVPTSNGTVTVQIDADYSFGKDGVIFGYITGIESTAGGDFDHLIDTPFSFRFRADDTVLTVKDVKIAGVGKDDTVLFAPGRYTDKEPLKAPVLQPEMNLTMPSRPTDLPVPSRTPVPYGEPLPSPSVEKAPSPLPKPRADRVPSPQPYPPKMEESRPTAPPQDPLLQPRRTDDAPPLMPEAGPGQVSGVSGAVRYEPRIRKVIAADGTVSERAYYEAIRVPPTSDGFTRPDGSNRLLGPAKQLPMPVPFEDTERPSETSRY